jgi:hypothetical protein
MTAGISPLVPAPGEAYADATRDLIAVPTA